MVYTNSNAERAPLPERPSTLGSYTASHAATPGSHAAPQEAAAEDEVRIPVLGKTLLFRGELTAEEDVILQGRVEGSIRHARNLIIGTDGSVLGDVYASHLTVEGLVEGDLHCTEAVIVRATAQVRGNIFAPRVGITEGATFNGRVEMDSNASTQGNPRPKPPQTPPRSGNSPQSGGRSGSAPAAASARPAAPAAAPTTAATGSAPLASTAVDQLLTQGANKK
jgi:cytoskeletal protein CcmA (bactofilin family)